MSESTFPESTSKLNREKSKKVPQWDGTVDFANLEPSDSDLSFFKDLFYTEPNLSSTSDVLLQESK